MGDSGNELKTVKELRTYAKAHLLSFKQAKQELYLRGELGSSEFTAIMDLVRKLKKISNLRKNA